MRQKDLRSKDTCPGTTQLFTTLILIGLSCVGASSGASATDFYLPAALMDGETPHDIELEACLESAIATGGSCILPEGTLIISRYPGPLRQEIADNGIVLDRNGATLRGQGPTAIIKGVSESGFDVLQLNGITNFNIRDLAITTCVTGEIPPEDPPEDPPCLMEDFGFVWRKRNQHDQWHEQRQDPQRARVRPAVRPSSRPREPPTRMAARLSRCSAMTSTTRPCR